MADPLSITAGVVGLTTFALQSSKALCDAIEKAKGYGRSMRELKDEASALTGVLASLKETLEVSGSDFSSLEAPLRRCGQLCQEFATLLNKCSVHADGEKFSFRGFLSFNSKGKDIGELRSFIAAYKSTISIALADANIVTAKLLLEYKQTIDNTASDLNELLERCGEEAPKQGNGLGASQLDDSSEIAEEKASIETCLLVCATVSKHIDEVQKDLLRTKSDNHTDSLGQVDLKNPGFAGRITSRRLENCKNEIGFTSAELRMRLQELDHRLTKVSRVLRADGHSQSLPRNEVTDNDLDSIEKCLSVCQEAAEQVASERVNVFGDVSIGDDGDQAIVSTFGDLISAKQVKAGARSSQILGQMSDHSFTHTVSAYAARHYRRDSPKENPTKDRMSTRTSSANTQFYGTGHKLNQ